MTTRPNPDTALFPREEDRYAGFVSRVIAFMIDVFIILIVNALLNFTIRMLFGFFGLDNLKIVSDFSVSRLADGLALLFPFILQAVYFIGGWAIFGRTIGMSLAGIRVEETHRPGDVTFTRAILRYAGMYLSILALGLGILWVLIDRKHQGWHDKLGNTLVVYSRTAMRYHQKRMAAQQNSEKTETIVARTRRMQ
jgi:uncharacterized RDD family membrane protein YckC